MVPGRPDEQAVFRAAIQIKSPQERSAYLDRACGSDAGLRAGVEELLRSYEDKRASPTEAGQSDEEDSPEPSAPEPVPSDPAGAPGPGAEACSRSGDDLPDAPTVPPGAGPAGPSASQIRIHWGASLSPAVGAHTTVKRVSGSGGGAPRIVVKPRVVSERPGPAGELADYQLLERIGEGGMGIVYAARQTAMDRQIALKMLKPDFAKNERDRARFLSEAGVTGDLDHPNIVPVHDLGSDESGALFYAMKHVRGEPWRKSIRHRPLAENLEILLRVADAVAFAHSRGVIHRDLKPENVMLGDFGEVLVMDWGLAASVTPDGKAVGVAESGVQGGTAAYMPPEIARGELDRIGTASDVYLLGAIMYELVTGRQPHAGLSALDSILKAAGNEVQPIEQPGELEQIALKALSTDPADRYATVKEFQAAVRDYEAHSESLLLSSAAAQRLARLSAVAEGDLYRDYTEIIAGQQQALRLWEENGPAVRGLRAAREAYVELALARGDLVLAQSQVRAIDAERAQYVVKGEHLPVPAGLRTRVAAAVAEATRKERIGRLSRRLALAAGVLVLLVTATAYMVTKSERDKARMAQAEEARQRAAAVAALREAEREDYYNVIALADSKVAGSEFDRAEELLWNTPPELRGWEWGRILYKCDPDLLTMKLDSPVTSVEFSPNAAKLATGSSEGADLWDARTGRELLTLGTHSSGVLSVAFSPDSTRVATANLDGTGTVWNAADGTELGTLRGHSRVLSAVSFSPDGKRIVTGSFDGTARVWDADGATELLVLGEHSRPVSAACFSPDGRRVLTGSFDGTAEIWDAETGLELLTLRRPSRTIDCAAFSHDGTKVVTSSDDGTVCVWDAADGKDLVSMKVPSGRGGHVVFSPDDTRVVSTCRDKTARIWDAATGRELRVLKGHRGVVNWAAFSPDGNRIVTASEDRTVRIWDALADNDAIVLVNDLGGTRESVSFASFFPEGQRVLTGDTRRGVRIWDAAGGRELLSLGTPGVGAYAGDVSPDGRRVVAPTGTTATVWDAQTGDVLLTLDGNPPACNSAVFSSDGSRVLTAGNDGKVRTWDAETGRELLAFDGPSERVVSAAFLPDSGQMLTVNGDATVRVCDAANGQEVLMLGEGAGDLLSAAFSRDGREVITTGRDGKARVWDLQTGRQLLVLEGNSSCAAFGPKGQRLATGGRDGNVRVWDAENGQELLSFRGHEAAVNCVAFSADGTCIVTAGKDGTAKVWKALDWTLSRAELHKQQEEEKPVDYALWLEHRRATAAGQNPVTETMAPAD